jgi:hypothetical protein
MKVRISDHTIRRAEERGTNLEEIEEVLRTGSSVAAKYGRMTKAGGMR